MGDGFNSSLAPLLKIGGLFSPGETGQLALPGFLALAGAGKFIRHFRVAGRGRPNVQLEVIPARGANDGLVIGRAVTPNGVGIQRGNLFVINFGADYDFEAADSMKNNTQTEAKRLRAMLENCLKRVSPETATLVGSEVENDLGNEGSPGEPEAKRQKRLAEAAAETKKQEEMEAEKKAAEEATRAREDEEKKRLAAEEAKKKSDEEAQKQQAVGTGFLFGAGETALNTISVPFEAKLIWKPKAVGDSATSDALGLFASPALTNKRIPPHTILWAAAASSGKISPVGAAPHGLAFSFGSLKKTLVAKRPGADGTGPGRRAGRWRGRPRDRSGASPPRPARAREANHRGDRRLAVQDHQLA